MHSRHPRLPGELLFLLLLVLLSAFMAWAAWEIAGFESITSAGAFPMACAGLMLLTSLINLLRALRAPPASPGAPPAQPAPEAGDPAAAGAGGVDAASSTRAHAVSAHRPDDEGPAGPRTGGMPAGPMQRVLPRALVGLGACLAAYLLALEPLGFLLASLLFLVVAMRMLGSRRLLFELVVSVLAVALIFVIFRAVFSVVLPAGTLVAPWLPDFLR